jgi:hypothetical protein
MAATAMKKEASAVRAMLAIGVFAAPSAAFSIAPRLATVLHDPATVDVDTVVFLIFQGALTVALVWLSHAAGLTRNWLKRLTCLGLVSGIMFNQFNAALELASHKRDSGARVDSRDAATVQRELTDALNYRSQLPQDPKLSLASPGWDRTTPVTVEMVAAKRDEKGTECGDGIGQKCRDRGAELNDLIGRRPFSKKVEDLEAELDRAPLHAYGGAYRLGQIIAWLGYDIGDTEAKHTAWVLDGCRPSRRPWWRRWPGSGHLRWPAARSPESRESGCRSSDYGAGAGRSKRLSQLW